MKEAFRIEMQNIQTRNALRRSRSRCCFAGDSQQTYQRRTCRTIILFIKLMFNLFSDCLTTVALCFYKTKLVFVDALIHTGDKSVQHFTNKLFCLIFHVFKQHILSLQHVPAPSLRHDPSCAGTLFELRCVALCN